VSEHNDQKQLDKLLSLPACPLDHGLYHQKSRRNYVEPPLVTWFTKLRNITNALRGAPCMGPLATSAVLADFNLAASDQPEDIRFGYN
jgi:hypothetical protein